MKRILLAAVLLALFSFPFSYSQDDASMKAWQDYMTPGATHQMLAKAEGKWKTHTKYWMASSDQPMEADGETVFEMILGGRYLKSNETSSFGGMPFQGMMLEGYDNAKKEITAVWVDNFGTGTMVMKGSYDPDKNQINLTGSGFDPMSGKDLNYRETISSADDKNMVMEMFLLNEGNETKVMETKYVRE